MRELTATEIQEIGGGVDAQVVIAVSMALGPLGVAFGFGYAIGTAAYSAYTS